MPPNFHPASRTNHYFRIDAYSPRAAYMANFKGAADDGWYLDSGVTHHLTNNIE